MPELSHIFFEKNNFNHHKLSLPLKLTLNIAVQKIMCFLKPQAEIANILKYYVWNEMNLCFTQKLCSFFKIF